MISVQRDGPCTGQRSIVAWIIHHFLPKPDIKGHPIGLFSPLGTISGAQCCTVGYSSSKAEPHGEAQLSVVSDDNHQVISARCQMFEYRHSQMFPAQMFEACQPFGFLAQGPQISGAEVCHSALVYAVLDTQNS